MSVLLELARELELASMVDEEDAAAEDAAIMEEEDAITEEDGSIWEELCCGGTAEEDASTDEDGGASDDDSTALLLESGADVEDTSWDVPPVALMLEPSTLLLLALALVPDGSLLAEEPDATDDVARLLEAMPVAPDPREEVRAELAAETPLLTFTFPELVSPLATHTSPLQVVPGSHVSGAAAQDRAQVPPLHA